MLQCVAVCRQCVAVCCSVLQCVAASARKHSPSEREGYGSSHCTAMCWQCIGSMLQSVGNVLQCVAASALEHTLSEKESYCNSHCVGSVLAVCRRYCSVLAVCCSVFSECCRVLQCVGSVLQCGAVFSSELQVRQCVAVCYRVLQQMTSQIISE